MADDGIGKGTKRFKPSEDAAVGTGTNGRRLESENEGLKSEIERLRAENTELRRQLLSSTQGSHDVLVITTVATVDLSCIDTSLVLHIAAFVGTSRELFNLALTCKSFGWIQPTSSLGWSSMEESARREVFKSSTISERSSLPRYVSGTTTWLSILHRFEHLLIFDVISKNVFYQSGNRSIVQTNNVGTNTAVASSYVMRSGAHYAMFRTTERPYIGIVRPMPNLNISAIDSGEFYFIGVHNSDSRFFAQRCADWGDGDIHACEYCCVDGKMNWTNWNGLREVDVEWEGREGCDDSGDTVGMLLNLDEGTLKVYKNNRCLGILKDGLSGPYCWYVCLEDDATVAIERGETSRLVDTVIN